MKMRPGYAGTPDGVLGAGVLGAGVLGAGGLTAPPNVGTTLERASPSSESPAIRAQVHGCHPRMR